MGSQIFKWYTIYQLETKDNLIILSIILETNVNDGVKMEIKFKRRLTNEIMTTFIPSFFLILISYATLYFKSFYFEAVVTINLTVLLVATNLFIRL